MMKAAKIGLVFPTNLELQPFLELMPELKQTSKHPWETYSGQLNGCMVSAIVSYIGPANVAAATERILVEKQEVLLHGGSAGAMNKELMPGDIVVGDSYTILCSRPILEARKTLLLSNKNIRYSKNGEGVHVEKLDGAADLISLAMEKSAELATKFPEWKSGGWPDETPRRAPIAVAGRLGSQDGWTKDLDEIEFIVKEFGVDSEDMESAYVAQIAAKHDVPLLTVRSISNNEHLGTLAKDQIFPAVKEAASRAAYVLWSVLSSIAKLEH
ncbi:MAG TPA: 5'-methylthioadenosine/S-adenosylhomocysteine nucleosidase [Drouetiella sp.]